MSGRRRRKNTSQRPANVNVRNDFWGDELPDEPLDPIVVSAQPAAMVQSLGRPRLAGNELAAEATFELVYARAALLAGALADSVGLLRHTDDD